MSSRCDTHTHNGPLTPSKGNVDESILAASPVISALHLAVHTGCSKHDHGPNCACPQQGAAWGVAQGPVAPPGAQRGPLGREEAQHCRWVCLALYLACCFLHSAKLAALVEQDGLQSCLCTADKLASAQNRPDPQLI
eukprot:scaffold255494_cov23-Tisochrysis_lutea.AAC.2